jgi:uncharacterized protein
MDKLPDEALKQALELEENGGEPAKILELLNHSAAAGNSDAQYALGTLYLHGKYVKFDAQKTLDFLRDAADQMHSGALFDLGVALEKGEIVKQNKKEAFRCYLHAMIFGDRQAIYEVARCLYYGIGTNKNLAMYKMLMVADDFAKNQRSQSSKL